MPLTCSPVPLVQDLRGELFRRGGQRVVATWLRIVQRVHSVNCFEIVLRAAQTKLLRARSVVDVHDLGIGPASAVLDPLRRFMSRLRKCGWNAPGLHRFYRDASALWLPTGCRMRGERENRDRHEAEFGDPARWVFQVLETTAIRVSRKSVAGIRPTGLSSPDNRAECATLWS